MVMHWARLTGEMPQRLVVKPTVDYFGRCDGGFRVDPASIRWDKVTQVENWRFVMGDL